MYRAQTDIEYLLNDDVIGVLPVCIVLNSMVFSTSGLMNDILVLKIDISVYL